MGDAAPNLIQIGDAGSAKRGGASCELEFGGEFIAAAAKTCNNSDPMTT